MKPLSWSSADHVTAKLVDNVKNEFRSLRLKTVGFLFSMWANPRLRWGLLLLLVIAPLSKFVYMVFPEEGFGEYFINTVFLQVPNYIETPGDESGWIYMTIFWWAWSNGELWAPLIAIYGIYLLFPKKYYPSYLVGIPFGYFLSLLVHRMFLTSNEEFHTGFGPAVISMFVVLGVAVFIISDRLMFNQNHRKRATEARIVGLINMPGMDWKDKEKLLKKEARAWSKQENEHFTRTA